MLHLEKPHPFIYNRKSVIIPGLITFLIITVFAPFGFSDLALGNRILYALAFGILSSLSVVIVVNTLRKFFPDFALEDSWTLGKEIILFVSVIATICVFVFVSFVLFDLSPSSKVSIFKKVVIYSIALSIVPVVILVLYEQYSFQKQSVQQALKLSENLRSAQNKSLPDLEPKDMVVLKAENGKMALQVACDKIIYMKADGNYVEVFYLDQDMQMQKKMIRNRLKSLLEEVPSDHFFHSHKSYIVNAKQIEQVKGNARNFELVLHFSDTLVPVSRSRSKDLSDFLNSHA